MEKIQLLPPPLLPSNPKLKPYDPLKHTRIMEKLKHTVLRLANSDPNKPLTPAQVALFEHRLLQAFPDFRTPTHPTYASMIQKAIVELKEEGGSTEESISEYIKTNFKDLPWAHKRYLSHHLGKLCENGEILCMPRKCYSLPGLVPRRNSKKKQLRRKSGRKRKEGVIEEEQNLGGNDEAKEMNVNEFYQEEEIQMFGRSRGKRRRSSLVVYDEDDEVEGTGALVRDENAIISTKMLVIKGPYEEVAQPEAELVESTVEKLPPNEGHDVLSDHDPSEGKTEPKILLVPSSEEKILPPARTEASQLDHSGGANLMLVPVESVKDSVQEERARSCDTVSLMLAPIQEDISRASMLNIEGDAPNGSLSDSAAKKRDRDYCAVDLMIVPFDGDVTKPVVLEEKAEVSERVGSIVCGLTASPQPCKPRSCQPKKRSKRCKQKSLLLCEESIPVSSALPVGLKLLEHEHIYELNPALLESSNSKEMPLVQSQQAQTPPLSEIAPTLSVEKGSNEHESEKQKLHLESLLFGGPQELMSTEDEDFNVPLQQVFEKCGKQRKLSLQIRASEAASSSLASSYSHGKLQGELPSFKNPVNMMLRREDELTVSSRKQKQGKQQQPKRQLRPRCQKRFNLEVDTAAETVSEKVLSFPLEEGGNEEQERQEQQEPQTTDSVADLTAEKVSMGHQQGEGRNLGSFPNLELTADTLSLDDRCHVLEENQLIKGADHLPSEPEQTTEVNVRESSPTLHQTGEKECQKQKLQNVIVGEMHASDSEPKTTAIMKEKLLPGDEKGQCTEKQGKKRERQAPRRPATASLSPYHRRANQGSQLRIKQPTGQGRPPNQKEATEDPGVEPSALVVSDNPPHEQEKQQNQPMIESFIVKPSSQCHHDQIDDQQGHYHCKVGVQGPDLPLATIAAGEVPIANQKLQQENKQLKIERRGRPRKGKGATENVVAPLNLDHQQQKEQPKKDRRGRPRKSEEVTKEDGAAPLNDPHHLTQEGPSESTTQPHSQQQNIQLKRKRRGRPPKHNTSTKDQQQKEKRKKDGRGRPRKKEKAIEDDSAAPTNLLHQEQEGLSDPSPHQQSQKQNKSPKKDGRGRPRKHVQQNIEKPERDSPEGPQKPKGSTEENAVASLNLDAQKQEQPSEPASSGVWLDENKSEQQETDVQISCPDFEVSATTTSGAVGSLDDRPGQQKKKQKEHVPGSAQKPEAIFSESQTDQQHEELKLSVRGRRPKSTHAPTISNDESHEEESEHGLHELEKQLHCLDKQPGQSQSEVHGACPEKEIVTTTSDDESIKQLKEQKEHEHDEQLEPLISEPVTTPLGNQLHQHQEQQCQHDEEKQVQLRGKEKTAKSTVVMVPLSSKDHLRSRMKRQS